MPVQVSNEREKKEIYIKILVQVSRLLFAMCRVHPIYCNSIFFPISRKRFLRQPRPSQPNKETDTVAAPLFFVSEFRIPEKYLFTSGDDGKLLHFRDFSDDDEFPILMVCPQRKSHNPLQWHAICAFVSMDEKRKMCAVLSHAHGIRFSVRLIHPVASSSSSVHSVCCV